MFLGTKECSIFRAIAMSLCAVSNANATAPRSYPSRTSSCIHRSRRLRTSFSLLASCKDSRKRSRRAGKGAFCGGAAGADDAAAVSLQS